MIFLAKRKKITKWHQEASVELRLISAHNQMKINGYAQKSRKPCRHLANTNVLEGKDGSDEGVNDGPTLLSLVFLYVIMYSIALRKHDLIDLHLRYSDMNLFRIISSEDIL